MPEIPIVFPHKWGFVKFGPQVPCLCDVWCVSELSGVCVKYAVYKCVCEIISLKIM